MFVKKIFQGIAAGALALSMLGACGSAQAAVITAGSNPLTVSYDYLISSGKELMGTLTFSNFTFTNTGGQNPVHTFATDVTITNTSNFGNARLTAFGFDTNPDAISASENSGVFSVSQNVTFPGYQTIDVCLWGGSNCSGGSNGGLAPGGSDAFRLTLGFAKNITSIDLTNFVIKYQTPNGSYEFTGTPTTPVPEPASLALLGSGLLGLGFLRRRKDA